MAGVLHTAAQALPPVIDMAEVDVLAAKLASSDGLVWTEPCGFEGDAGDCDSSTCIAAHYEDHDPAHARDVYRRLALVALAHAPRGDLALHRVCAEVTRWCDHVERFAYDRVGVGLDASPHMLATVARRLVTIAERSIAGSDGDNLDSPDARLDMARAAFQGIIEGHAAVPLARAGLDFCDLTQAERATMRGDAETVE